METSKKYRLLKDLPGWSKGKIFSQEDTFGPYTLDGMQLGYPAFSDNQVENSPEWFEEVKEPEKPKRKAPAYVWIGDDWTIYGLYTSEQEAKDDTRSFKKMEWPALPDSDGFYPGPKVEQKCTI